MNILRKIYFVLTLPISSVLCIYSTLRRFLYNIAAQEQTILPCPVISVGYIAQHVERKELLTYFIDLLPEQNILLYINSSVKNLQRGGDNILQGDKDDHLFWRYHLHQGNILSATPLQLGEYVNSEPTQLTLLYDAFTAPIYRDMDIIFIDATVPMHSYALFPVGSLRERLRVLNSVDWVIIYHADLLSKQDRENLISFLSPYVSGLLLTASLVGKFWLSDDLTKEKFDFLAKKKIIVASSSVAPFLLAKALVHQEHVVDSILIKNIGDRKSWEDLIERAEKENAYLITSEVDLLTIRQVVRYHKLYAISFSLQLDEHADLLERKIKQLLEHC